MQERRIEEFDGRITPAISRCLRRRRLALGLSYERLAEVLGVSWSTVRKWELGECSRCTLPMQKLLAEFLAGCYDERFLHPPELHGKRIHNANFDASQLRLQRIKQLCLLGERHPQALADFEQALTTAAARALQRSMAVADEKTAPAKRPRHKRSKRP